jgi:hypothetical protein
MKSSSADPDSVRTRTLCTGSPRNTILAVRESLPDLEKLAPNRATAIRRGLADAFGVDAAVFD